MNFQVALLMLASGRMARDTGEESNTSNEEQFMKDIGEMVK